MTALFRITPSLWDKIHHFASFRRREELPVRLAHRVKELDELPHSLSDMPSIKKVKNWYAQSFEELITFPPINLPPDVRRALNGTASDGLLPEPTPNPSLAQMVEDYANNPHLHASYHHTTHPPTKSGNGFNKLKLRVPMERRYFSPPSSLSLPPQVQDYNARFTKTLEQIKTRHDPTVTTVAQGVLEWKRSCNAPNIGLDVQAWLDRFYMSRIGIRFLIGQHIALNSQGSHPDYVGIICTNANVHDIVQESIENARFVCEEHYAMFRGPPVQLICPPHLEFAYVPGHLSHIVFELLKNSLRAVVERFGVDCENYPPIKVVVVEGTEDITIKISDEGGGIPRSAIPLIWTYMYTTMEGQGVAEDFNASDFKAPMAGFGYGLPLSRLYARYFGGDLRLIAMDGFGTDVYIHLNRLSSSREPLP
ncbi:alpha-ketoacid dehydrogenase kinase [Hymenopellis radicata]|nr:alpha-ketoacid dehydrogenase kinase [Hymenopellis radicata]